MKHVIFHRSDDSFGLHKAPCYCTGGKMNSRNCPECGGTGLSERWGFEQGKVLITEEIAVKDVLPYVNGCSYITAHDDTPETANSGSVSVKDTAAKFRDAIKARLDFHALRSLGWDSNEDAVKSERALRSILSLMTDASRDGQGIAWIRTDEIENRIHEKLNHVARSRKRRMM